MNRVAIIFIWVTFSGNFLYAQSNKTDMAYTESTIVHINNNFLITGETLYFSIHCLNNQKHPSTLSKLAYLELIGENEKPFLQTKIVLTEGKGAGDFFLPSTLPSGNYTLIAYTKWMRNFSTDSFFQKQITIVNPYLKSTLEPTTSITKSISTPSFNHEAKNETELVRLSTDNKRYYQRQKVTIVIKNNNLNNACRVSLNVHYNNKTIPSQESPTETFQTQISTEDKLATFLPDLKGETIGGSAREIGSKQPVANTAIYLSASSSPYLFQMSRTDSAGRFYFSSKNIQTQNGIKFQLDRSPESAPTEVILDDEFINDYQKFKPLPFSIDTTLRKQVEQRNIYSQIENAYFNKKNDSIITVNKESFFGKPDKVFKLDDYTRFPTMEDIFREYMYEVVVLKRDGKFLLRLINSGSKNGSRFSNSPLILLDGLRVFDTDMLMNYNPLLIKSVSLITRSYVYGGLQFDGILSIDTYKGDAQDLHITSIQKTYVSWQRSKKYYSPVYNDQESLKRIPDYRYQLFWNPDISIEPGQEFVQEFYTSDIDGNFIIEVKGFASNGEPIAIYNTIEILKK